MSLTYSKKVSSQRLRKPDRFDSQTIRAALEANIVSVREAEIVQLGDAATATNAIVEHYVSSLIVDEAYLVVYDLVNPWYSTKEILVELLVLRIGEGSSFTAVTDLLDDLAAEHDAAAIHAGSSFSRAPSALVRLYSRQGYVDEGKPSLIKRR